jgi:nitrogen fixation NifU-like protein
MSDELEALYQAIILEHNRSPRGWGAPERAGAARADGDNPFCGDRVTVWVQLDGACLAEVRFEAQSCAIAKASASLMTEAVRGLDGAAAAALFARLEQRLRGAPIADGELGALVALSGVAAFPVRIACATLPWTTLATALARTRP